MPSIYEGLPNVICEAMLFGCPVIASDVSDNSVILGKNNERGILCDPHSPMSIYDAIERLEHMSNTARLRMIKSARIS